jgi:two-component system phosphate regulon response regulator PhoB
MRFAHMHNTERTERNVAFHCVQQAGKVLVLEGDSYLREAIVQLLQREQYEVTTALDGNAGLQIALQTVYGQTDSKPIRLIILDQLLPQVSGLTICQRLRQMKSNVPILMTSSKTSEADRVLGLDLGADDYLPKPFSMKELLARCRVLTRQWDLPANDQVGKDLLAVGDVVLDRQSQMVYVRGEAVFLAPREFQLLRFFMQHPRRVLSRELLVQKVWGQDSLRNPKTLDVHIRWLRQKLEINPSQPQHLITLRGFGYRFG